jgi:CDP-Glycerol:Poly(glycerophosphate) glycerophosphotransferase
MVVPENGSGRRIWLLLVDPLPNRVFFDCGIVDGLRRALPDRLAAIFLLHPKHVRPWLPRLEGLPLLEAQELLPVRVPFGERVSRRADLWLDERMGFFPLAVRHSKKHGFHQDRWQPGHSNWFLDPDRAGPLPSWDALDRTMTRWHFSSHRYAPSALVERMRAECAGLVVTNLQARNSVRFLTAARRLDLPVAGYVASWDHTVGKGVVSRHLRRYIVQNETMRGDLVRYHGIDPARVVVTGWPQTDVFHRRRPRSDYEALLHRLEVDPEKPVVLFAGNTPTNAPYEGNLVRRLARWLDEGAGERLSIVFRPHPRDSQIPDRYGPAVATPGAALQERSYTDLDDLATLLQHVDCLVSTAGTILLDALVNGRPSVCVVFDEGAPPGESWADLNLVGEHYRELAESEAFYRAHDFDALVASIDRALEQPHELADERSRVTHGVVGKVDGKATARVVQAIVETFERAPVDQTS